MGTSCELNVQVSSCAVLPSLRHENQLYLAYIVDFACFQFLNVFSFSIFRRCPALLLLCSCAVFALIPLFSPCPAMFPRRSTLFFFCTVALTPLCFTATPVFPRPRFTLATESGYGYCSSFSYRHTVRVRFAWPPFVWYYLNCHL